MLSGGHEGKVDACLGLWAGRMCVSNLDLNKTISIERREISCFDNYVILEHVT